MTQSNSHHIGANHAIGNKVFCVKAFAGLSISPSGSLFPCCLFERPITKPDGVKFSVWNDGLDAAFNSEFMVNIRRDMLDGKPIEACRQCYQVEANGGYSMRQDSNLNQDERPLTGSLTGQIPVSIDLKLNNKCNLKCRMCQPRDSHLIFDEFSRIQHDSSSFGFFSNTSLIDPDLHIPLDQIENWATTPQFRAQFDAILPKIKKISLVGGEPLLLDETYDLLEHCIQTGAAANIFLAITSNFVHVPTARMAEITKHFRKTLFNISLDATDEQLYYIRFPTKLERVLENFQKLYQASERQKVSFQFSPTVQVYNILYLHNVYHLVEAYMGRGYEFSRTPLHATFLEFPQQLNIRILPKSVRESAIAKLEHVLQNCPRLMVSIPVRMNLEQVIKLLREPSIPESEQLIGEFLYYTEQLDKKRGQRMADFLPELANELKQYSSLPPKIPYYRLREQGWDLAKKGKLSEAIACFMQTVLVAPDPYLDWREMGWMYLMLKDYNAAMNCYQQGIALNPHDTYLARGLVLTQHAMGSVNVNDLARALALNPQDVELLAIANEDK
jgi:MoaA/NifB/PqqE/SkfB family radical SAM enzyme